ncbi:MAG: RyR domain-containing protein, partial [Anaerolineales bacterium]
SRGHSYKAYLRQAVEEFLEFECKETAFGVYRSFFDSYRITLEGRSNPFIDLLDVLLSYEERASTLIDKQRDHYVHSVNVFLLGLSIYAQNQAYRDVFTAVIMDKKSYPFSYDTQGEEFFYRWGIASLFHDVGYPVEIIGKQINKFIGFAAEVDLQGQVKTHLEFENFDQFNSIAEILPKEQFTQAYRARFSIPESLDLLKPNDLLAHKLHRSLGVDLDVVKRALDDFPQVMAEYGFIDHGYYSAIIVLRWYGFLIQSCGYKPEYFYYPILDSASAILLHNYYKNVMMKAPFNLDHLSPQEHPIAFLLILCDELQEWNRTAYGILDKRRNLVEEASISIGDDRLEVTYIDKDTPQPGQFAADKEETLSKLLDMESLFTDGFSVKCEMCSPQPAATLDYSPDNTIIPRQLLKDLEELAAAIHDLYNQKQQERHPGEPLAYPHFSDLPDSLKYSNLRQAQGIAKKVQRMGWEILPKGSPGEVVTEMPDDIVEALAVLEHEEWMRERLEFGWTFAEDKNTNNKTSPYLVPYDELSEEIKELDRDTIRNIPVLLDRIGLAAYVRDSRQSPPDSDPLIARRLPESYTD